MGGRNQEELVSNLRRNNIHLYVKSTDNQRFDGNNMWGNLNEW